MDDNRLKFLYSEATRLAQVISLPLFFVAVVLGISFFRPIHKSWEIPVIYLSDGKCQVGGRVEPCVKEVLVWGGESNSKIELLVRTGSRDVLSSIFSNARDSSVVRVRVKSGSDNFIPGSSGLSYYLSIGRRAIDQAEEKATTFKIESDSVEYLESRRKWVYLATIGVVYEDSQARQEGKRYKVRMAWEPVFGDLRNEIGHAVGASSMLIDKVE